MLITRNRLNKPGFEVSFLYPCFVDLNEFSPQQNRERLAVAKLNGGDKST
jgi:hypothetical protein